MISVCSICDCVLVGLYGQVVDLLCNNDVTAQFLERSPFPKKRGVLGDVARRLLGEGVAKDCASGLERGGGFLPPKNRLQKIRACNKMEL